MRLLDPCPVARSCPSATKQSGHLLPLPPARTVAADATGPFITGASSVHAEPVLVASSFTPVSRIPGVPAPLALFYALPPPIG